MFQAAKQTKIFQDVVEQIQEAILDGRLEAGDTLETVKKLTPRVERHRSRPTEAVEEADLEVAGDLAD